MRARRVAARALAAACLALAAAACDPGEPPELGSILECGPAESDPTVCCDPTQYEPVDPARLLANAGAAAGMRVAVRGTAMNVGPPLGSDPCIDMGEDSLCPYNLAVSVDGCNDATVDVLLGGTLGGQAVGCPDNVCYPLDQGARYAVCGQWALNPTLPLGGDPSRRYWLEVERFCLE